MFDPVDPKQSFPDLEHGIIQYWKEEDIFKRSVKHGDDSQSFSFYDGPPFATGLPHYGHLLAGTIKDVIPRYQTMRGKKVARRFGWDCHGLPVENLVEKEEGLQSKKDIEEKGIQWFNDKCRASVQRYTAEWKKTVERTGRWVDMDHDYRTMDPDYMESIWWVFKELHQKKLIYEGRKSMHVCPRCVTPLSNFEVTLGYNDVADWSVTPKFQITNPNFQTISLPRRQAGKSQIPNAKTYALAWTTTGWTLPGNLFLAVGPTIEYAIVGFEDAHYVLAKDLVESVFKGKEFEVIGSVPTQELIGKSYEPLFPYFAEEYQKQGAFRIVEGDFVTTEEGTGIVHIATGFGTDDYEVGKREGVEVLSHVGMDGQFVDAVTDFAGQDVKPADDPTKTDKKIGDYLQKHGRLFDQYSYKHSYPHCWRCDAPLINYAASSWFVAIDKIKQDMLKANAETQWVPAHIRDGRFGKWLENAKDWAISRNRFWGTPLPIWRTEEGSGLGSGSDHIEVVGSRDELMSKCPERFTKITALRHAQSEGNVIPIYQGEVPGTDLTALGKKQAKAVAKNLQSKSVDVIYCSPLARTQQTAAFIAKKTGANIVVDDRLREVHFGPEWEGKTVDFSDLTFVKERRAHKLDKEKPESIYHFDGMETWASVQERIGSFFNDVLPKHKGEHIVLVSHADPIVNMKHYFTAEDPIKLSHQPFPEKAEPHTFFWDHERSAQLDLHSDTVDDLTWQSSDGRTMKRIPDVLDCWFESGSMPYAQSHFPFEHDAKEPPDFPADFIAEGLDQTRGWFYTLMVLSSALFKKPAFQHCIVNGIVLAEDGKKMSKRLKNYPEPDSIMEKYGADAMRFSLMSSPAVRGENLRFSERSVEETVRRVILPLWNAYSFFVLHANEAGWEASGNHQSPITNHQGNPNHQSSISSHPLDLWIKAEVQDLVNRMTEELDRYDLSATCSELYETLDGLTNWYIRRSRRRFAGKERDEVRAQAIATLYDVLLTFSKLLAPFCPFVTDAIYLNLVPEDHTSIHLSSWPEARELSSDERAMIEKARLIRTVVSLGMGLRAQANIKVRQPLSHTDVALCDCALTDEEKGIIAEELNVKNVRVLNDVSHMAERTVHVDARAVGPRLGSKVQEIIKAAKAGEFTENANGSLTILDEKLSADEASIVYQGKEGHEVASEKGIVVALDTELTDELKLEGVARDIIRAVQSLRKEKGLNVSDRISLKAEEGTQEVLQVHQQMIEEETNGSFDPKHSGTLVVNISLSEGKISVK